MLTGDPREPAHHRPTLPARRVGDLLRAWCPHCRRNHTHGAAGGYGHRVAHCRDGPFKASGYYLVAVNPNAPATTKPLGREPEMINNFLTAVPGGCAHCGAHQTVHPDPHLPRSWTITVRHDDDCDHHPGYCGACGLRLAGNYKIGTWCVPCEIAESATEDQLR